MSLAQILSQNLRGAKVPRRFQPLLNQAGAEALVRYGGQYDQLNQLREQSALQMRQAQAQATSAAQLEAALAGQAQHNLNANTNPLVARLAAYDNAPANSSAAVVAQNLGLTHDATNALLSQAAVNAPIRASQQGQQASAAHLQDLQRINAQRASLLGEAGNYITGRTQDLITGDRKQRSQLNQNLRTVRTRLQTAQLSADTQRRGQDVTKRGQDIASADRQAAIEQRRQAAAQRANKTKTSDAFQNKYGVKPATSVQLTNAKNKISYAVSVAKTHKGQGDPRKLAAEILVNGQPTFKDPQSGQPVPGIKAVDPLWASIGLDLAYDGHLSNKNAAELHRLGYSVKALGLPSSRRRPSVKLPLGGGNVQLPQS